jgi:ABC-2 type transport system permease protein
LAFVVYLLTTILTLITFVGERSNGTLERVLASPVTEGEIVTGYAITFGTFGIIQVALLLIIAIMVFNIMVVGNVLLAFLAVAILAVTCQALGILLSSLAKRPEQAIQFACLPSFRSILAHTSYSRMVKAFILFDPTYLCCGCLQSGDAKRMGSG